MLSLRRRNPFLYIKFDLKGVLVEYSLLSGKKKTKTLLARGNKTTWIISFVSFRMRGYSLVAETQSKFVYFSVILKNE